MVGVTDLVPFMATVPMPGSIETLEAFAAAHERVADWPFDNEVEDVVSVIEGLGEFGGGGGVVGGAVDFETTTKAANFGAVCTGATGTLPTAAAARKPDITRFTGRPSYVPVILPAMPDGGPRPQGPPAVPPAQVNELTRRSRKVPRLRTSRVPGQDGEKVTRSPTCAGAPWSSTSTPRPARGALEAQRELRRSGDRESERSGGRGHPRVVGDHRIECVPDLDGGREIERIERSGGHGLSKEARARIGSPASITLICATTSSAFFVRSGATRRTARTTSTSTIALATWTGSPARNRRSGPLSGSSTTSLTSAGEST